MYNKAKNKAKPQIRQQKIPEITRISGIFMVDDTRLELVTSRTSSGCATSCANRPALDYFKLKLHFCQ